MKKLAALIMLILWSVSMTVSASASMTVLCIETNGKAVVEYSAGVHCADASKVPAVLTKSAYSSIQCANCVDSSLGLASFDAQRLSGQVDGGHVATDVPALVQTLDSYDLAGSRGPYGLVVLSALRSTYIGQRRTIVIQQ